MEKIILALFGIVFIGMIAAFTLGEIRPSVPESTPCGTAGCPVLAGNLQATPTPVPEKTPELKAIQTPEDNKALEMEILEFSTDKNVYSSNQKLKAFIVLNSNKAAGRVTARLHGINAQGTDRIDSLKEMELKEGENSIEFLETTPYCTAGCSGVFPGPYQLLIEISDESGLLAQALTAIELVKG
jgi:hypothetical protein